jgi:hypothetical protein
MDGTSRRRAILVAGVLLASCLLVASERGPRAAPSAAGSAGSAGATIGSGSPSTIVESSPPVPTRPGDDPRSIDRRITDPDMTATSPPTTEATTTTAAPAPPAVDPENPAVVARPIPTAPAEPPPAAPRPPWASSTRTTSGGYLATDVGCATGTGAGALDAFFAGRLGPVIGTDYQHVYSLGDGRYLWIFQDAFIDHSGGATRLGQARFAHNIALLQEGACFTLLHRGTAAAPASFEGGSGERPLARWFWPMGGEVSGGQLLVFWAEMEKDGYEPGPGDGLGWHPARTWLASYDTRTLARTSFTLAPNPGVHPIYGYAVSSDPSYTYLFGNSFEQNLVREGGFWAGPHSGTQMWLARSPVGQLGGPLEYWTGAGWSPDAGSAQPFLQRYWTENPMQPRYMDGQWVSATKIDGYWGEELSIDVALDPWGPWTTVQRRGLSPRGGDPAMNTYHAHLLPWREGGALVVSVSQNARNMVRDAYPRPERYRPAVFNAPWVTPPPPPPPPPETTTTVAETTTTATTTTTPTTTVAPTTTPPPTTTRPATTTTSPSTTTSSTSTTTTTSTTAPTSTAPTSSSPPAP